METDQPSYRSDPLGSGLFPRAQAAMTVDPALLLVVVAFLLPLRLISFALCLASEGRSTSARHLRRSCAALAVAAALLAVIYALPRDHASECAAPVDAFSCGKDGEGGFREELHLEVEQLKLQLSRLESHLDSNSRHLDEKSDALYQENDLVMRAMGLDIQSLINEQENIKAEARERKRCKDAEGSAEGNTRKNKRVDGGSKPKV